MLKAVTKLFGNENEKILKRYRKKVVQINALESEMEALKDEEGLVSVSLLQGMLDGSLKAAAAAIAAAKVEKAAAVERI